VTAKDPTCECASSRSRSVKATAVAFVLTGLLALLAGPTSALAGYQIVAKHSGKCLDVSGRSTADGAAMQQYECQGPSQTNQIFDLVAQGGSYYQLVARHSGKCVDVPEGSKTVGKALQQWSCLGPEQENQIWKLVSVSGSPGYYEFKAKHSGQCIDVSNASTSNGVAIKQYTCGGQSNQQWALRSMDPKEPPTGGYQLVVKHSSKCLDVSGVSMANGASMQQWECLNPAKSPAPNNQIFDLVAQGGSYYQLVARHSGKCVDVPSASTEDGITLQQWACLEPAKDHQLWKLAPVSGSPGYFEIKAKHSSKCADVYFAGTSNGTAVKQYTCGGQSNQRWSLRSVDAAEPPLIDAGFESLFRNWNTAGVGEVTPAVISSDWRTGTHSADFKLTGSQDRSELILGGEGNSDNDLAALFTEGDEYYYGFAFKILSMTYGKPGAHNLIMQLKSEGEGGPNFGLQLWDYAGDGGIGGGKGIWTCDGNSAMGEKTRFLTEVSEKQWHDIVIHFFASSEGKGSYELYLDGAEVDSREGVSTIVPGREYAYIKNGLYRNGGTNPGTSEILLDNAKLGTTLASVSG
jgi:hypothetical protein